MGGFDATIVWLLVPSGGSVRLRVPRHASCNESLPQHDEPRVAQATAELAANPLVALTPATIGANAATWSDSAGGSVVFNAGAGAHAPQLVAGVDGQAGVRFSGSQYMNASFGDTSTWTGVTVVAVFRTHHAIPALGTLLGSGGATGQDPSRWAAGIGSDPTRGVGWAGADATTGLGGGGYDANTPYIMLWKRSRTGGWTVRRNGFDLTASPVADTPFPSTFNAYLGSEAVPVPDGSHNGGHFTLNELQVYARELDTAETSQVEQELATAYDINWYAAAPMRVKGIGAGYHRACVIREDDGAVFCWGAGRGLEQIAGITDAVQVDVSNYHLCAVLEDHTVRCSGNDVQGELGDGPGTAPAGSTVQVLNLSDAVEVAVANSHTCALRETGEVACWGSSSFGQMGDGTTTPHHEPSNVPGVTDAVAIGVGIRHTCAVRANGEVLCWGYNNQGQLGDGTKEPRSGPVAVATLQGAAQVDGGVDFSCARRTDGTVACWGRDGGQLGDGTVDPAGTFPVEVIGLGDAIELSVGEAHACARRQGGDVVCWGNNAAGQLGDGTNVNRFAPTPMASGFRATALAAGFDHHCAFGTEGAVVCWGSNEFRQLSNAQFIATNVPRPVVGLRDAVWIDASNTHTCALRAPGTAVCWGNNGNGQLGDGTVNHRSAPVDVQGLDDATAVTVGGYHSCARREAGDLMCWGIE